MGQVSKLLYLARLYLTQIENILFARWHGIDVAGTVYPREMKAKNRNSLLHAMAYQPVPNRHLRMLFKAAKIRGGDFENFLDIGAGKGKACFYAASRKSFLKIIGVEFSEALFQSAAKNAVSFGDRSIEFKHLDAVDYTIPDGRSFIFMFNPFDAVIMDKFLVLNREKIRETRSVIGYVNDNERAIIESIGMTAVFRDADMKISVYRFTTE